MVKDFERLQLEFIERSVFLMEMLIDLALAKKYKEDKWLRSEGFDEKFEEVQQQLHEIRAKANEFNKIFSFDYLVMRFDLTEIEANILLMALIPSVDTEVVEKIRNYYGGTIDYMSIDFILKVLFEDPVDRLDALTIFSQSSKLVANDLIEISPVIGGLPGLQGYKVEMPEHVAAYILGKDVLSGKIREFATIEHPENSPDEIEMDEEDKNTLIRMIKGWQQSFNVNADRSLIVEIEGRPGSGKTLLSSILAATIDRPLIRVDCSKMATIPEFAERAKALFHEAWMRTAVVVFEGADYIFSKKQTYLPVLYEGFERYPNFYVLTTNDHKELDKGIDRWVAYKVTLGIPTSDQRLKIWERGLKDLPVDIDDVKLAGLANSFELTPAQILNAIRMARDIAGAKGLKVITKEELEDGAYAQIRAELDEYAMKRRIKLTFDDLVLPPDEKRAVMDILDAARNKQFIMTRWGFGKRLVTGKGLVVMFIGEPGTGKTLCAEILASQLGQGLYQISIPRIMSKYIGETEKNIERVFRQAKATNSILLFDEADALFTKRVKVQSSVDRFSNMEINLLLQEIERFDGIVILTSNLEKNIDKAFERRINFKIRFPFPGPKYRAEIWKKHFPPECPIADDIDWEAVGQAFEFAGGHIKNAVLRAAYMAAKEKSPVSMRHIIAAAEAEAKAAGKLFRRPDIEEDT